MPPNTETSVSVRAAKILQAVKEKPDHHTIKSLAEHLHEDYQKVQKPIQQLMEAKFLSWNGDKLMPHHPPKARLDDLAPAMERMYLPYKPNYKLPRPRPEHEFIRFSEPAHPVASQHQEPLSEAPTHGFEVLIRGNPTGLFTWPYQPFFRHEDLVHLHVPCKRGPLSPPETLLVQAWDLDVVLRPLPWL
ncbi:hypothetical protein [Deinococcus roseus]|uniref:Uncharacterized protein n=1 Tax=Deinococcus roseus TaxID=392414 RepID=A0ABQ2D373_9DEIO|nr:hypothetical protein [Deinococcus roseus]GGJ44045.1 hypothetical protein GCM10008938_32900 [Deinococcus roseus]